MFRLLESLGKSHSNYAPYIYKTLTIVLIENYRDLQIRHFIFANFKTIFDKVEGIPLAIFLEPYIKQITMNDKDN
jgi:hypothetical protein